MLLDLCTFPDLTFEDRGRGFHLPDSSVKSAVKIDMLKNMHIYKGNFPWDLELMLVVIYNDKIHPRSI